ncbi:MAG TPA: hypothetical protein DCS93_25085 [Microscillaceae bacterium]|nr:hypothetical protein [Microscillaceae bacterium]
MKHKTFPFSAIVGQDDFKRCLILNLIDRSIGGVLALGDKGTGKTTTVRAISHLMQPIASDFRLVNLPIGASEDRVLGSVDLEKLVNDKTQVLQKGLLAQAHQGMLYIDEVNLLSDYLIDILLDAAATGGYHLEREGLSGWQESQFALVGTMNPEEGELRPQLLDRFGLSVQVATPQDLEIRKTILRHRLAFDQDPTAFQARFAKEEQVLQSRILQAKQALSDIEIPEACYDWASRTCQAHEVEGLRADILLLKTAKAYAAWQGDTVVAEKHLQAIAPFVLGHRSKNPNPPNTPPSTPPENNSEPESNESPAQNNASNHSNTSTSTGNNQTQTFEQVNTTQTMQLRPQKKAKSSRKGLKLPKANALQTSKNQISTRVDTYQTLRHYTLRGEFKLIPSSKEAKAKLWVYFLIDSSGSMARKKQISYTKGIIAQTLKNYQGQRIRFAAVALVQGQAKICHSLTQHPQVLLNALEQLPTGGKTNLIAGFQQVHQLIKNNRPSTQIQQQLYIFTDGRINSGNQSQLNPTEQAIQYYRAFLRSLNYTLVIDTESSFIKLGKAQTLANQLGSDYQVL